VTTVANGLASAALSLNELETHSLDFAELSDMYRYFRLNSFRVDSRVYLVSAAVPPGPTVMLFEPNNLTGGSPTYDDVEGKFAVGSTWCPGAAGEAMRLELGPEELHTITPWFVTLNDTAAGADTDGPGVVRLIMDTGAANDGILFDHVQFSATFRSPLDPQEISSLLIARWGEGSKSLPSTKVSVQPELAKMVSKAIAVRKR